MKIFTNLLDMADSGLGQKIAELRKSRFPRVTQQEMADYLGVSRAVVANWETGVTDVAPGIAERLAEWWGIDVQRFFDRNEVREVSKPYFPVNSILVPIPLWPPVPAGDWETPDADWPDFYEVDPRLAGKGRIATKILGGSMLPLLEQGDFAVFHLDPAPPVGTIVLARNGSNEATVKVLARDGADYTLKPLNPQYDDAKAHKWQALGYLVGIVKDRGNDDYTVTYKKSGIRV